MYIQYFKLLLTFIMHSATIKYFKILELIHFQIKIPKGASQSQGGANAPPAPLKETLYMILILPDHVCMVHIYPVNTCKMFNI